MTTRTETRSRKSAPRWLLAREAEAASNLVTAYQNAVTESRYLSAIGDRSGSAHHAEVARLVRNDAATMGLTVGLRSLCEVAS